jgi:hypothetical protein
MAFETVVFNEGEPLDPDKLTKLQNNILGVYTTASIINTNVTNLQGQATTSFSYSDKVKVQGMSANKFGTVSVPVSNVFTDKSIVVVSIGQAIGDGTEAITMYTKPVSQGSFTIAAKSTGSRTELWVNYIITDKKAIQS